MGIPRFAYRVRDYGVTENIGSKHSEASQTKVAVIDGPSLAHFVFQNSKFDDKIDHGIVPNCDYAALGNATTEWLDRLQLFGFKIEAIFFDGALPSHKRHVRIERLQSYIDKLVHFKQLCDEINKATRCSRTNTPTFRNNHRLEIARKDLASPPFLVLAIIEALQDSSYAQRTYVVSGEADPFCAIAAQDAAMSDSRSCVTIFTNDSDLIVYNSGPKTKVAMINSVGERQAVELSFLEAFQFHPRRLATLSAKPMSDLIRPAYEMLDLHVSFPDALTKSQIDIRTRDYEAFAESYSLIRPTIELEHLRDRRAREKDILQTDPRISELICQAIDESQRLERKREIRGGEADSNSIQNGNDASQSMFYNTLDSEGQLKPHQYGRSSNDPPASNLDMFLPMLLEDPSRASAWKVGVLFRGAAGTLLLEKFGLSSTIVEHRKSGNRLSPGNSKKVSLNEASRHFAAPKEYTPRVSPEMQDLTGIHGWMFFVMQLTLLDLLHENVTLSDIQDVVHVLSRMAPGTWDQVHLLAQYQAEYYSLRMLKEVMHFLGATFSSCLTEEQRLYGQLKHLPSVSQFFDAGIESDILADEVTWQYLVKDFLAAINPTTVSIPAKKEKGRRKEVSTVSRERPKGVMNDENSFAILCEE